MRPVSWCCYCLCTCDARNQPRKVCNCAHSDGWISLRQDEKLSHKRRSKKIALFWLTNFCTLNNNDDDDDGYVSLLHVNEQFHFLIVVVVNNFSDFTFSTFYK